MKIKLRNMGTINTNELVIEKDDIQTIYIYFSYETIVGVSTSDINCVSVNNWGNTTGKLLNKLEPDKSKRVKHEVVIATAEAVLKGL